MPKHELASATCITVTPLPTQGRYVPAPAGPHPTPPRTDDREHAGTDRSRPARRAVRRRAVRREAGRPPDGRVLDYHGVLTPIVDRPEDAVMSDDGTREAVQALTQRCAVYVLSGPD